jgi:hypothetical protein
MTDKYTVQEYVREQYLGNTTSFHNVMSGNQKIRDRNEVIIEMARNRYSHLNIPDVIRIAKQTIAALELVTDSH